MATKKELTLLERFEMKAATLSGGKAVFNKLVKANVIHNEDFMSLSFKELLAIPGIGRHAALLVMEVACDLAGKK